MYPEVKKFLHHNTIATLSIVDFEGFPYSSTMHYAQSDDGMTLYFFTNKDTHKVIPLLNGATVKASVVIGFSEKDWLTVQMEGTIHIALLPEERTLAEIAFYMKFPNAERGHNIAALVFKEQFWKFTDYSKKPWKIITSKD